MRTLKLWLYKDGLKENREKLAIDNGLSAGAVTNLVNEWRQGLGFDLADRLGELAVALSKVGISPAQCALGFRVAVSKSCNIGKEVCDT